MIPCVVRYGCSLNTTFGLTTESLALMTRRCLEVLYSADVMVIASGSGLMVTVAVTAADVAPPVLVAVIVGVTTLDVVWPTGRAGAVKVTVAVLEPVEVTTRLSSAGAPLCATLKVRFSAGTFGSLPLTPKLPGAPENT